MHEFVYFFRSTEADQRQHMGTPEQAQRSMQAWLGWIRELETQGHLKDPGRPLEMGGQVARARAVTDGPYVEVKDLLLGFMIVQAKDLAAAVDISKGCPLLQGGGSVEVRPVGQLPA